MPITTRSKHFAALAINNKLGSSDGAMEVQLAVEPLISDLSCRPGDFSELPPYARHLLKVSVPVSVQLVGKKQTINDITRLVPGSIINFDKSCDAPLELFVNNRLAARGETVKVGERFGLQISEIVLPPENFAAVKKRPVG